METAVHTKTWLTMAAWAAVASIAAGPALAQPVAPAPPAKAPKVVVTDAESETLLAEIDRLVRRKNLREAAETLHELMGRREGFVPAGDGKRMLSVSAAATRRLAAMGSEALEVYRGLYEAAARSAYDKAVAAGDLDALRAVGRNYAFTAAADAAQRATASVYFNRGEFARAAAAWQELLDANSPPAAAAELQARTALAWGLAGKAELSRAWLARLKSEHAGAKGSIGGKEQDLAAFVEKTLAGAPATPAASPAPAAPLSGHLRPAWRFTAKPLKDAEDANVSFLALQEWLSYIKGPFRVADGHVFHYPPNGPVVSPMVQAQLRGGLLLVRDDEGLAAIDAASGETKWRAPLPMVRTSPPLEEYFGQVRVTPERRMEIAATQVVVDGNRLDFPAQTHTIPPSRMRMRFRYGASEFREDYRNTLAATDETAFVVGGFVTAANFTTDAPANLKDQLVDDSFLAAISLGQQGKVLWKVGQGYGDDEMTRAAKYLVPPTIAGRRVLTVAIHQGQYVLACLDAATGSLLWKTTFAAAQRRWAKAQGNSEAMGTIRDWACPPLVAGDRVIVSCSGVLAAFDQASGAALWAYEYPEEFVRSAPGTVAFPRRAGEVNPLVLCGDTVIAMPADNSYVFALSLRDGSLRWSQNSQGLWDLSAIDDGRVLLSGRDSERQDLLRKRNLEVGRIVAEMNKQPASAEAQQAAMEEIRKLEQAPLEPAPVTMLAVLSAADGNAVFRWASAVPLIGRPVVTDRCILASAGRQVLRLDLADYHTELLPLAGENDSLGNLLLAGSRLYAANVLGLFAYDITPGPAPATQPTMRSK